MPSLFIGSSREGSDVARSIQENLERDADCSVWNQGLFELSEASLQSLLREVERADFGVFVCSADDVVAMRGNSYAVARDNVLFELGMFMAKLGQERTFFLIPHNASDLHLPTDLSGITSGTYNAERRDGRLQQATAPFCTKVRRKIQDNGFRRKTQHERLDNLSVAYACCEWIPDEKPYRGVVRWQRKDVLFNDMVSECKREQPNKKLLSSSTLKTISDLILDYTSSKIRLISAIEAIPEKTDIDLLLSVNIDSLTDGNARIKALNAAKTLVDKIECGPHVDNLIKWSRSSSSVQDVQDAAKRLYDRLKRK